MNQVIKNTKYIFFAALATALVLTKNTYADEPMLVVPDAYVLKSPEETLRDVKVFYFALDYCPACKAFEELFASTGQTNAFKIFSRMLTDKSISVQTEVYKDSEHMGTAIPTFERGIQLFLAK